uniref:Uncharacterized protein n=1 Tax=Anguilla anguilla TaxID=7936 RepID=A0A0E9URT7_ANGAN
MSLCLFFMQRSSVYLIFQSLLTRCFSFYLFIYKTLA